MSFMSNLQRTRSEWDTKRCPRSTTSSSFTHNYWKIRQYSGWSSTATGQHLTSKSTILTIIANSCRILPIFVIYCYFLPFFAIFCQFLTNFGKNFDKFWRQVQKMSIFGKNCQILSSTDNCRQKLAIGVKNWQFLSKVSNS